MEQLPIIKLENDFINYIQNLTVSELIKAIEFNFGDEVTYLNQYNIYETIDPESIANAFLDIFEKLEITMETKPNTINTLSLNPETKTLEELVTLLYKRLYYNFKLTSLFYTK